MNAKFIIYRPDVIIHCNWQSMVAKLEVTQFQYALCCFFHTSPLTKYHYTWWSMMVELEVTQYRYALSNFFYTSPTGHQSLYKMITFQHCHGLEFSYSFRVQNYEFWQDSLKIQWATSTTAGLIVGLFVHIWIHFSCWSQIWQWKFEFFAKGFLFCFVFKHHLSFTSMWRGLK